MNTRRINSKKNFKAGRVVAECHKNKTKKCLNSWLTSHRN